MWCLWAALAFGQPADPQVAETVASAAGMVMDGEIDQRSRELGVVAARVESALNGGEDPRTAADLITPILVALGGKYAVLRSRAAREDGVVMPDELDHLRGRLADLVVQHRATLVTARLAVIDDAVKGGELAVAKIEAATLETELRRLAPLGGTTDLLEGVVAQLRRVQELSSDQVPPPPRPEPESLDPGLDPTEPQFLRWRVGVQWTLPNRQQGSQDSAVRRDPLGGGLGLAISPKPSLCGEVRAMWDRWQAPGEPYDLELRRWRVEGGYCPRILAGRVQRFTLGLRPVVGFGIAGGVAQRDGAADQRLLGVGLHGRVEGVVQLGGVEVVPSVGLAPYGRTSPDGPRIDWPFVRPVLWGLSLNVGRLATR